MEKLAVAGHLSSSEAKTDLPILANSEPPVVEFPSTLHDTRTGEKSDGIRIQTYSFGNGNSGVELSFPVPTSAVDSLPSSICWFELLEVPEPDVTTNPLVLLAQREVLEVKHQSSLTQLEPSTLSEENLFPEVKADITTLADSEVSKNPEPLIVVPQPTLNQTQTVQNSSATGIYHQSISPEMLPEGTFDSPTAPPPDGLLSEPKTTSTFWTTEAGELVSPRRVNPILRAQDVITAEEECVYNSLWGKKRNEEQYAPRIVQVGFKLLSKQTRLSKRTISRVIAKLIAKDFIEIHKPGSFNKLSPTEYRVFSYKTVLDRHREKGRSHVAKIGKGLSYVHSLNDPRVSPGSDSAVAKSGLSTVAKSGLSTVAKLDLSTVAKLDPSTVVPETTSFLRNNNLSNTTSSVIYQALSQYGSVDDETIKRLIKACEEQAPDCTQEEILHFIQEKGSVTKVRNSKINTPIGFLLIAVPKCFAGDAFRLYREEQKNQREEKAENEPRRQSEREERRRKYEAWLADPEVPEMDKQLIRIHLEEDE